MKTYWEIGRQIVEFEQKGKEKADYGERSLKNLGRDLSVKFNRGFSWRNLFYMRRLYLTYPKLQTLSAKLTWSHYKDERFAKNECKYSIQKYKVNIRKC